ncbi:MrcB family domain-containing protein [Methylophilus sp. Leaf414]|uniref:MrcB family domain-containing protein n=1 Tax=Methylophilus sp. Leaf414 TaxID=1736371 RepID=UPI0006F50433|nr:DUF3578 domain-containing protein [Methylophilus sp. Leaf414]KQT34065.1 hypothetical protein ASG24_09925 [Methylophilus sp. Leaf414]
MSLHKSIKYILDNYKSAKENDDFAEHAVAEFVRHDFVSNVQACVPNSDQYVFKGSAGQGVWVLGPWLGIFNPIVTDSASKGYYVCYLFSEDTERVYLSLNQAMTEAKKLYRADAATALKARAKNFRAILGGGLNNLNFKEIDLKPSNKRNNTYYYQAGNILAKEYRKNNLPSDAQLIEDLRAALALYEKLIISEAAIEVKQFIDGDEPGNTLIEDATKLRIHKRIERNPKLVKQAKQIHGFVCQACGFNFESVYGDIGKGYIEAHHLEPISKLKGTKVSRDPKKDFAVLCSNCHRMIHKSDFVGDVGSFKKILKGEL